MEFEGLIGDFSIAKTRKPLFHLRLVDDLK